jgi:nicotinamide riboside kinase
MKIYFSGSHSSGKSTIARYTANKYNLPLLPEIARMVLAEQELQVDALRSDINAVNDYQSAVFARQIEEEKKHQSFVSDRCLIDAVVYATQHSAIGANLIQSPEFKTYIDELHSNILFFVRPSKATLKNDGVREHLTWDGIVAIDAMIKFVLEINSIRYFQINTDSMQERIRLVDAVLSLTN